MHILHQLSDTHRGKNALNTFYSCHVLYVCLYVFNVQFTIHWGARLVGHMFSHKIAPSPSRMFLFLNVFIIK